MRSKFLPRLLLAACFLMTSGKSLAINITIRLEDHGHNPAFDPDGQILLSLFEAAATHWESQITGIESDHAVDVWWEPLEGTEFGRWEQNINPFGNNDIRISPNKDWFLDPTPLTHEEFDFSSRPGVPNFDNQGQPLVRDLSNGQRNATFSGNDAPPDLLEVGFRGIAIPGTEASGRHDALTVILHELGHDMGVNETEIGDFELSGVAGDVGAEAAEGGHLAAPFSLMQPHSASNSSKRILPSVLDVLAAASANEGTANLARKHFTSGTNWNSSLGWIGAALPSGGEDVYILAGQLAALSAPAVAGSLTIDEGSIVDSNNRKLDVNYETRVIGVGSKLIVDTNGTVESTCFKIESSATVSVASGALLDTEILEINAGTELNGVNGIHTVHAHLSLTNDGRIASLGNSTMRFTTVSNAPRDLDGASETGVVDALNGSIEFTAGSLADGFSSTMKIGAGKHITMALPWQLHKFGRLELQGGTNSALRAYLAGGELTLAQAGAVVSATGASAIDAPFTVVAGSVSVAGTLDLNWRKQTSEAAHSTSARAII